MYTYACVHVYIGVPCPGRGVDYIYVYDCIHVYTCVPPCIHVCTLPLTRRWFSGVKKRPSVKAKETHRHSHVCTCLPTLTCIHVCTLPLTRRWFSFILITCIVLPARDNFVFYILNALCACACGRLRVCICVCLCIYMNEYACMRISPLCLHTTIFLIFPLEYAMYNLFSIIFRRSV